jgi:LAO/AO transport system kinase
MSGRAGELSPGGFAERLLAGDRLALARGITQVERRLPEGRALIQELIGSTGSSQTLGITGPPGAGKSTLVTALTTHLRAEERQVAVLSIDPSSQFTGGALLGDRVRMTTHYLDEGVFIRSMASRGISGGLAPAALDAVLLMDAAGFDPVFIETVGVGQSEIEIASHADTIILVLVPGAGDSIQMIKAGIMEIPDIIVVNKADHPLALEFVSTLRRSLPILKRIEKPRIVQTEATTGRGIPELATAIADHRLHLEETGLLQTRRERSLRRRVLALAADLITAELAEQADNDPEIQAVIGEVIARRVEPMQAAERIVDRAPLRSAT